MTAVKLPEYQDFKAPWEKSGSEVDPEKAKRFLYTLQKQIEGLEASVASVTAERDEFKGKVDEAVRKDESEVERLKRELQEATEKAATGETTSIEVLKLRVALKKGLSEVQAKRLVGTNEAELEADADELVTSFGGKGKAEELDAQGNPLKRTPQQLNNSGDPNPEAGTELTWEQAEKLIPRL